MQIFFLVKIKKMKNLLNEEKILVSVFDPIANVTRTKIIYAEDLMKGYSIEENVNHYLRLDKNFTYGNFTTLFTFSHIAKF